MLTFQCLIIAPADADEHRAEVRKALEAWNAQSGRHLGIRIEPVEWTTHGRPTILKASQPAINEQLVDGADFGIAFFWSRVGTPTAEELSGSVEEIERLRKRGKEVLLFFSSGMIPGTTDPDQLKALNALRDRYRSEAYVGEFKDPADLGQQVAAKAPPVVLARTANANRALVRPEDAQVWRQLDEGEKIILRLLWRRKGHFQFNHELQELLCDDLTPEAWNAADIGSAKSLAWSSRPVGTQGATSRCRDGR